jgi:hypothetical protein
VMHNRRDRRVDPAIAIVRRTMRQERLGCIVNRRLVDLPEWFLSKVLQKRADMFAPPPDRV